MMDHHKFGRSQKSKTICVLCVAFCVLLFAGCGEKENKNLVNARELVQVGKYKESQDITKLKGELNLLLESDSGSPEALCPLYALEIIASSTSAAARQKAVKEITSLLTSLEKEIKELEAIDKDLLTDDDKDRLKKLNRKWCLSLEPAAIILKSETEWISDVGKPAVDLLIELLKAPNPAIQSDVVQLLISLKAQTVETLIKSLEDESAVVRRQAVIALGKMGDASAVEFITRLLDDQDPGVRLYVPVALDMIGGEEIVASLHKALKNEMAKVRTAAANILGRIEDETGISLLIELLADNDSYVRTSATNALTKIGKPAVPELIEVLEKRAENITLPPTNFVGDKIGNRYKKELAQRAALQVAVASILGSINDARSVDPLLEALGRKVGDEAAEEEKANAASVRSGAAAALGAMGPAAVEPLINVLVSSAQDENTRISAASILGAIGDKRAVEPLINALKDGKKSIRAGAAASLGTLKDRRAVPFLIAALEDSDVVTRANTAASLGIIVDKRATQSLISVVMNKNEREKIRSAAISSLGTIKDTAALNILVTVLIDEYEKDGIRKSAAAALRIMENVWASEPLIGLLKGEIVHGVYMPGKGTVARWLKEEGDGNLVAKLTPLVEVSIGSEKTEIKTPDSGKLVKIYIQQGEEAEAGDLIGLVSFEDKDIDQEERSSIRSAAASALGKVKGDNALATLMRSLRKDKSAAVRTNAATSLKELEKADARSTLIKALKSDDSGSVRSAAANALATIKGGASVPPLMRALQNDKYDSTREKAAWALGEIADKRAVGPSVDAIVKGRKGKPEASSVVSQVITTLDKLAGNAVDPLVAVMQSAEIDEVPRGKAAKILGLIASTKAVEPLMDALKDESVVVRSEAVKSLGLITDRRAVAPLIDILGNKDEWVTVRANVATALQKLKDERAVLPLIDALDSKIAAIRSNAVVALGALEDKRATMPLVKILENEAEDDVIRTNAISSLSSINDPKATDALMVALGNSTAAINQSAATALGVYAANAAVQPLMVIVGNVNEPTTLRANAAEALGKIGGGRALPLLRERLADKNESDAVWKKVAVAAGKLEMTQVPDWVSERAYDTWEPVAVRTGAFNALSASPGDISTLMEMLGNGTVAIRYGAALALGETGSSEAVQPLADRMFSDGEETVRRDCAKGLAALADPVSEEALIKAHKEDATDSVRIQTAIALGNIKGKNGITALIATVQDTTKGNSVRANAAMALGTAGSAEAVSALKAVLEENAANIHFEAAEALRKITGENYGYER